MKQYEVGAAVRVVRDALIEKMQQKGYSGFVSKVAEHNAELIEAIFDMLDEDERKKREGKSDGYV
jgi:hypothetical protein